MRTVYRASDLTIQSVMPLNVTPPSYYPAAKIVEFVNASCNDPNRSNPAATSDSASSFLLWIIIGVMYNLIDQNVAGYTVIRNLLALPLFVPSTKPDFNVTPEKADHYVVKQVYRVTLWPYSIYGFCVLSIFSLAWCGCIMLY